MNRFLIYCILACLLGSSLLTVYVLVRDEQENPASSTPSEPVDIRKSAVADRFYPGSPQVLESMIAELLTQAPYLDRSSIQGLVCPHAGYVYSGPVAAWGYKQLSDCYDTVILLGPSHYVPFEGASIPEITHYETPLGLVPVSEKASLLREQPPFTSIEEAHLREHCLEVQLPFLQTVLSDFKIIPIVLGAVDTQEVAHALLPFIDDRTLLIASSDLSHYNPYELACTLDAACTRAVPNLDFEGIKKCEACGMQALLTLMHVAQEQGWEGELLTYKNSGDTAGDKERVVGYMSVAFYGTSSDDTGHLTQDEQDYLLHLARETLELYIREGETPRVEESELTDTLKQHRGCFVTLNKAGMLRGCIGSLTAQSPLYEGIIENTINAAVRDPRFPPVTAQELADIEIEISVLTPPQEISYDTTQELIEKIEGKGVIIQSGYNQATFLPQVWEQLSTPEEFLSHLCMKAGLSSVHWKEEALIVFIYTAQVFS
jgi:hypothetical protein